MISAEDGKTNRVQITVVIPTIGRPEVSRAVLSAAKQKDVDTQIIVVVDRPDMYETVVNMVGHSASVVPNRGHGGAAARNEGARIGSGDFIAFLDDDDWWEPTKLAAQVAVMRGAGANFCFGSAWFHSASDLRRLPGVPYNPEVESLASYMVRRPGLRFGYSLVQSSSFIVSSEVARTCGWDSTLRKHQDWDYALRLEKRSDVTSVFLNEPLVHVAQASVGSVSKQYDPDSSLRFLKRHAEEMDNVAYADFVGVILLRGAFATQSGRQVAQAFGLMRERWSGLRWPALVVALSGLYLGVRQGVKSTASCVVLGPDKQRP
ncbi:glycosyltransferase family 2 protein [Rhodococcus sp. NPDC057297]|uniref:glycosyltransferase family 2 protein n=1 Tax=Rhodococcus sp. NPDC057297 TaxID=3346090 RepID=UPI00363B3990